MYWMTSYKNDGQMSFYADTEADVANLPTSQTSQDVKKGSDCFVIETSDVYILNSQDTWVKI